ncbi:phosphoglycerate dehydrogenase [Paenibacillus validus]|uniref:Phosphoglycerate dehydrogenase n=1 Tax=Paenibacillus validus TaxID=44253 RepID=A0A7X2ZD60_9BACL|nr:MULTISPECIES: phosphoglycerate dehydrogenase [Paenibacillus]MED4603142.1 phosphoglycerate dehydrogenase [Paenibacillus validus]MED4607538.1 phosphoglycerate dehydrogenase [Paenibacillus validus]MUG72053.1 phosphoglycerate dehydrogenase [Paenibacillus validus]
MTRLNKVLVTATNYSTLCAEAKRLLEEGGCEIIENRVGRPHTFEELVPLVSDIDGVIAGVDTWDEAVFKLAPNLKAIARFGVGVDNIDLAKAREYGIQVTNVPGGNANAVAELAVGLILSMIRNIPALHQSARRGYWDRYVGEEIQGKTVGLLGFGNIAQMTAKKLQGFDVKLIAYDKYPNADKAKEYGVELVSSDDVLKRSDVVSMHLPSLKETYHMMSDEQFSMMKKTAFFVNTARGALVDEKALHRALQTRSIAGAAIDVYEQEPVSADNPLFQLDNLISTPHTAAETVETYRRVGLVTAQALLDVFAGKEPANLLR